MPFAKTVRSILKEHPVTDPRGALIAIEKALAERDEARKKRDEARKKRDEEPAVLFRLELTAGRECRIHHPGFPEAGVLSAIAGLELCRFVNEQGQ